jgi:hypothetical protein
MLVLAAPLALSSIVLSSSSSCVATPHRAPPHQPTRAEYPLKRKANVAAPISGEGEVEEEHNVEYDTMNNVDVMRLQIVCFTIILPNLKKVCTPPPRIVGEEDDAVVAMVTAEVLATSSAHHMFNKMFQ